MENTMRTQARLPLAALVGSICLALMTQGCGRPLTQVTLEPMHYGHKAAPIEGAIELCLTRALRMRQWNVSEHPVKIDLGERAALNLERLAKSAFRRVAVSFVEPCGQDSGLPWLQASILAANREPDSLFGGDQATSLTMQFELYARDGELAWSTTTQGEVTSGRSWLHRRKVRAAEDFGRALAIALEAGFQELVEAGAVRSAVGR